MEVIGIVVLFNPEDEIIDIYKSYKKQFEKVIFVDNSIKINTKFINLIKSDRDNLYYSFNENIGLSRALDFGCKIAIKQGFEYACLLDQDTYVEEKCILELKKYIRKNQVALVAPNIKFMIRDKNNKLSINRILDPLEENKYVNFAITSGSLIDLKVYKKIGGVDTNLFIGQIDQDYCTNLIKNNFYIYRVGNSFIQQEAGKSKVYKIFNKEILNPKYPAFRYYYIFHNERYLRKKWGKIYDINKVNLWKYIIIILFFEKDRFKLLYQCILGFYSGDKYEKNKLFR